MRAIVATKFTIVQDIDKIIVSALERTNISFRSASSADIRLFRVTSFHREHYYVYIKLISR